MKSCEKIFQNSIKDSLIGVLNYIEKTVPEEHQPRSEKIGIVPPILLLNQIQHTHFDMPPVRTVRLNLSIATRKTVMYETRWSDRI